MTCITIPWMQERGAQKLLLAIACMLLMVLLHPRYVGAQVTGECCGKSVVLSQRGTGLDRCFDCKEFMESGVKSWKESACQKIRQMGPLGRVNYGIKCGAIPDCSQPDTAEDKNLRQNICKQLRDQGALCCDLLPFCDANCQQMLAPNPNAAKLLDALLVQPVQGTVTPAAKIAIGRFLQNCEGEKLLNEISKMPCPAFWNPPAGCTMGDKIKFKLRFLIPGSDEKSGVDPGRPYPDPTTSDSELLKKFVYTVSVHYEKDSPPGTGHGFPTPDDACFTYTFSDGSSQMADSIYHELLHIWWINKYQTDYRDSGHGTDLQKCANYDPKFVGRLKDFDRVMDGLEKCLKPNPNP